MTKFFRRTVAGISALSILAAIPGLTAFAAETAPEFKEDQIPVVLYSQENMSEIDCRYYADMPSIPYVKLGDFYGMWAGKDIEITAKGDGAFDLKTPFGTLGSVDTEKDLISTEDRVAFFAPPDMLTGDDPLLNAFVRFEDEEEGEQYPAELDLAKYEIDLRSDAEDIWFPVTTLCDLFMHSMHSSTYFEGMLLFEDGFMTELSGFQLARSKFHSDYLLENYQNGRPEDLVKYNYNEMCLVFDFNYGFPGRPYYTDMLREKGFDATFAEANSTTKRIREFLNSADFLDYNVGVSNLNMYLWDGGHTGFNTISLSADENFYNQYLEKQSQYIFQYENATDVMGDQMLKAASEKGVKDARDAMLQGADFAEKLPMADYCEKGDTAFFSFDDFALDNVAWVAYYQDNGALPEDVVSSFYQAVKKADENPKIKKFVIDLGTNGGGISLIVEYMMGVISDLQQVTAANGTLNAESTSKYRVDKNLDKEVNDADKNFKTDLRFGMITSKCSFSCGSWMPSLARDNGILLIGEQSGGGACAVEVHLSPDGTPYSLSTGTTLVNKDGESIDLGIKPDYETVKVNEDGSKDFSETYDLEKVSKLFDEFYGSKDPVVTEPAATTPAVTESTASESTTTETTSAVTSSETTASTSATTETTATETTVSKPDPAKYFAPVKDMGKMAVKDYETKTGKTAANSVTKENADGTVTIDLIDLSGNVIDTYTINPETGIGTNSKGAEVNLPQTGNNSLGTVAAVAAALALLGAGAAAVKASRKKEED